MRCLTFPEDFLADHPFVVALVVSSVHIRMRTARIRGPPQRFQADHPFVFLLSKDSGKHKRRNKTVKPIFVGRMVQPDR
ncbi:hypothetical protein NQ315_017086 [Exocentrus adspersus]|uniref:Uncharacterized protein n=1 Tax=Exocentrus adspersus TaxID=1586481 RepID=A0AAV8VHS9_9CUCU|nr:hypothetical protein NQ315_017086 [Exocentrus adspersus]